MIMTPETAEKVVEFIVYRNEKIMPQKIYITFHGGEPLLGIDTIDYIIDKLKSRIDTELYFRMRVRLRRDRRCDRPENFQKAL